MLGKTKKIRLKTGDKKKTLERREIRWGIALVCGGSGSVWEGLWVYFNFK